MPPGDYRSVTVHEHELEALHEAVDYSGSADSAASFIRYMVLAYDDKHEGDVLPDELRERIEERC